MERSSIQDSRVDFLLGGGEMGDRIRQMDWSLTPFGPAEHWPGSLKTSISIMLASRFAMVVAWGPEFRFFYNDRYRPVLGVSKHPSALGTPAKETFPEAWPFIGPLFESTRRGESVALDDVLIPLDRYGYLENCYFTLSYSPIRDESGGVGGMLAVVAETTERVEGERRLRTLRELARRSAEAETPEQACRNAAECFEANPIDVPFCLFYLLNPDSKDQQLVCASGMPADHPVIEWPVREVAESREVRVVSGLTERFAALPGGPYPESAHTAVIVPLVRPGQPRADGVLVLGVSPRRALDDSYRGFYELAADHILSGLRNALAHQEERKRARVLAELDRAKTEFFSNVSHEFRTPLTLTLGPLENLLRKEEDSLPAGVREEVATAHRNSLRLLKLVNSLLDFSRIEAGRTDADFEPVDLSAYTAELASVFRSTIERAGLEFVVECPPLAQPVHIDREMWEKIVFNLLSNAFKFTFQGRIAVELRQSADGYAALVVRDTGIGIPSSELSHIFERFHRVKGVRGRTYEGTGIGLALVQELARLHGGHVQAESIEGEGSTFTLSIPFGHAHLPAARSDRSKLTTTNIGASAYLEEAQRWLSNGSDEQPPATPVVPGRKARVLLADDNADMRDYVTRLLSKQFEVIAMADGQAALEEASRRKPDLILSDVMMPRLDGIGLVQALRSEPELRSIPIILLSARAGEESRLSGLAAGADDYLVKPFSARELTARVETHLQMTAVRTASEQTIRRLKEELEIQLDRERARASELSLQYEVARTIAMIESVPEGLQTLLAVVGDGLGWDVGTVWNLDRSSQQLRSIAVWHQPRVSVDNFKAVSRQITFARGAGLPGRVWESASPVWIEDVTRDDNFPRVQAAQNDGLHSAVAFPILLHHEVLGVIEFFNRKIIARSEDVLRMLGAIGNQVGQFIERKHIELERDLLLSSEQKARSEAEIANRLKDEFLATVSHELRTPLTAILGWARLMRGGKLDEERTQQALAVLERNAVAQQQIIEDILDTSRIITGKLQLQISPVDISNVVEAAVDSIRPSADAKGVGLYVEPSARTNVVYGDVNRLQQIIWNLLSNSVKFTQRGGEVRVFVERVESRAKVSVQDTGRGISEEFLPFVFDRFRQADSSITRMFGGLGLGLAIVRHLTELHGGVVGVSSAGEGLGATFSVSLPLASSESLSQRAGDESNSRHTLREQDRLAPAGSMSLKNIKVLAVDDEADARELLTVVLTQCGAEVKTVGSAHDALTTLVEWRPDVLLSDIGMPDEDGLSLIRKIRALPVEQGRDVRAAALTAYARSDDRARALAAGFQTYVTKPVEPAVLIAVVASLAPNKLAKPA